MGKALIIGAGGPCADAAGRGDHVWGGFCKGDGIQPFIWRRAFTRPCDDSGTDRDFDPVVSDPGLCDCNHTFLFRTEDIHGDRL